MFSQPKRTKRTVFKDAWNVLSQKKQLKRKPIPCVVPNYRNCKHFSRVIYYTAEMHPS